MAAARHIACWPSPHGKSTLRYIWTHTRKQQLWILLVVAISMIPYFMSFDLPKQIVNGPIQGKGFEQPGATERFLDLSLWLPGVGSFEIFQGFALTRMQTLYALSAVFLLLVIINGLFKLYINTTRAGSASGCCGGSASISSTGSCGSRRPSSSA